jgi:hypothetical protein
MLDWIAGAAAAASTAIGGAVAFRKLAGRRPGTTASGKPTGTRNVDGGGPGAAVVNIISAWTARRVVLQSIRSGATSEERDHAVRLALVLVRPDLVQRAPLPPAVTPSVLAASVDSADEPGVANLGPPPRPAAANAGGGQAGFADEPGRGQPRGGGCRCDVGDLVLGVPRSDPCRASRVQVASVATTAGPLRIQFRWWLLIGHPATVAEHRC